MGHFRREKTLFSGIEPGFFGCPARSLGTVPSVLFHITLNMATVLNFATMCHVFAVVSATNFPAHKCATKLSNY